MTSRLNIAKLTQLQNLHEKIVVVVVVLVVVVVVVVATVEVGGQKRRTLSTRSLWSVIITFLQYRAHSSPVKPANPSHSIPNELKMYCTC